jgi:WD40 repeat protein
MNMQLTPPGAAGSADAAKLLVSLKGHAAEIKALAFSPDRCLLASAGADDTVRVWDIASSKPGERAVVRARATGSVRSRSPRTGARWRSGPARSTGSFGCTT